MTSTPSCACSSRRGCWLPAPSSRPCPTRTSASTSADFTDNTYCALTELDRLSGSMVDACNRSIAENNRRDTSLVYYELYVPESQAID